MGLAKGAGLTSLEEEGFPLSREQVSCGEQQGKHSPLTALPEVCRHHHRGTIFQAQHALLLKEDTSGDDSCSVDTCPSLRAPRSSQLSDSNNSLVPATLDWL